MPQNNELLSSWVATYFDVTCPLSAPSPQKIGLVGHDALKTETVYSKCFQPGIHDGSLEAAGAHAGK